MRKCGNAAMLEGALCVAARRQSLRVVLRRPAMPSALCPMPREASAALSNLLRVFPPPVCPQVVGRMLADAGLTIIPEQTGDFSIGVRPGIICDELIFE
jgi:hypothetical protein